VLAQQRQGPHRGTREERTALVDGIGRLAVDDDALGRRRVDEHLREREDRLLRAVGRHDLRSRIQLDAEAARAPAGRRLAQLGQPGGEGIRGSFGHRVDQRLPDDRIGRLVRVALAEVDHLDALRDEAAARFLETDEGIRRHPRERRRDRDHALTLSRKARSVA
jgi:hypothetical protein